MSNFTPKYDSTLSTFSEEDITHDSLGRILCKEHLREICHQCCLWFNEHNRAIEEGEGLIREKTEVESAAEDYAIYLSTFEEMELVDMPDDEDYKNNARDFQNELHEKLKEAEDDLRRLAREGKDVESAKRVAMQAERNGDAQKDIVLHAMLLAWYEQNPGKDLPEDFVESPEYKKIYWMVASPPPTESNLADLYTCAYCKYVSTVKLTCCGRCKRVSYCSKKCQKICWEAHKKECIPSEKAAKSLPLTWAQVEAHGGLPVEGETLEVRAMLDEMPHIVFGTDRVGDVRRIAGSFTSSPSLLPDLKQGSILRWKSPRLHRFVDGSNGARIEEEDLVNITVTN